MSRAPCIDPDQIIPVSRSSTQVFKTGTWSGRVPLQREKVSPCRAACPVGNHISKALHHISRGDLDRALGTFLEENPLPGVCGRVCYHPCQDQCNGRQWDGALAVRALERAASELGKAQPTLLTRAGRDHPVAVVGSGPAGLSAAYHLARMGHPVTIFEAQEELGGLLRWGIPRFRLPLEVLEQDLERILSLDIRMRTGVTVDAAALKELRIRHSAVFLAAGAQRGLSPDVPGLELDGVCLGVDFLKQVGRGRPMEIGEKAVIIGGGNVAVDAALTCLRLGAEQVELVCLEPREQMPAHEEESRQALEEGVIFHNGWGPAAIVEKGGRAAGVELVRCLEVFDRQGRFKPRFDRSQVLTLEADQVIVAVGQAADLTFLQGYEDFSGGPQGVLSVDPRTMETSLPGIFAGGDLAQGPGTVAQAVAAGKRAALAIHFSLCGGSFPQAEKQGLMGPGPGLSVEAVFRPPRSWDNRAVVKFDDLEPLFLEHHLPEALPRLDPVERSRNFREINQSLSARAAVREAERCFFCGMCNGCDRCFLFCPDICIEPPPPGSYDYRADSDYCKGCAVCVAVCPRGVMTMGQEQ